MNKQTVGTLVVVIAISIGCADQRPTGPTAEAQVVRIAPAAETTLVVPPASGARASNAAPRLVLRSQPGFDSSTTPPTITGTAPLEVTLNLCQSDDADAGDSLNWQFHFGDSGSSPFAPDGSFRPDFDHECRVTHTYREGSYLATLSVTDKHLEDQSLNVRAAARTTTQVRVVANRIAPLPSPPAGLVAFLTREASTNMFATANSIGGVLFGFTGGAIPLADIQSARKITITQTINVNTFSSLTVGLSDGVAIYVAGAPDFGGRTGSVSFDLTPGQFTTSPTSFVFLWGGVGVWNTAPTLMTVTLYR